MPDRLALARLPPVAEASTDLSVRKAPVLFGWAEQVRAKHDLRPDGDPTQGDGAVKSGGTRVSGRNRISLRRLARHATPEPLFGGPAGWQAEFNNGNLPTGLERSGDPADLWHKRSRSRPRSHLRHARRIATEWRRRESRGSGRSQEPGRRQGADVPTNLLGKFHESSKLPTDFKENSTDKAGGAKWRSITHGHHCCEQ